MLVQSAERLSISLLLINRNGKDSARNGSQNERNREKEKERDSLKKKSVAEVSYFALSFDGEIAMDAVSDLVHRSLAYLRIPCIMFCCTSDSHSIAYASGLHRMIGECIRSWKGLGRK